MMPNKKIFPAIILTLFVCSFNSICQNSQITPQFIVDKMVNQYSNVNSYQDTGTVEEFTEDDPTHRVTIISFKTYFSRPKSFRFEWMDEEAEDQDKNFSIVWFSKDKANFYHGGSIQSSGRTPNFYQAILGAKTLSRDSVYDIPVLLNQEFGENWLKDANILSDLSEETFENEDCYVVRAELSDSTSVDMWISKNDSLLRKVRKKINESYWESVRREITLNQGIAPEIFNYKLKTKAKSYEFQQLFNNEINRRGAIITAVAILLLLLLLVFLVFSKRIRRIIIAVLWESFLIEFLAPAVILIGLLNLEACVKHKQDFIHAFGYEFMLIGLIYMFVLSAKLIAKQRRHSKKETELWINYSKELMKAQTQVTAFNTRDFTNFFQPLGLRYFLEQINALNFNENFSAIKCKRIVVLNEESVYEEWIANALRNNHDLEEHEELLYNLVLIHQLYGIDLHLVTKKEVLDKLPGRFYFLKKWIYRNSKLDRLIVDEKCWHPTNSKFSQHYKFSEDKENANLIKTLAEEIASDENLIGTIKYNLDMKFKNSSNIQRENSRIDSADSN